MKYLLPKLYMDLKQYPASFKKKIIPINLGTYAEINGMYPNTSGNFYLKALLAGANFGQPATNFMGVKAIRALPDNSRMFCKQALWSPLKLGIPILKTKEVKKFYNPNCA